MWRSALSVLLGVIPLTAALRAQDQDKRAGSIPNAREPATHASRNITPKRL